MKQFDREAFIRILKEWDAKHHLLGKSDPFKLYKESVDALKSVSRETLQAGCFDLGAGNGILGIPALLEGFSNSVVLIEPLVKRVAFLEAVRGEMRKLGDERHLKLKVVAQTVQNVSRETIERLAGPEALKWPVITRAFSGKLNLADAVKGSVLSDNPLYKFSMLETSDQKKSVLLPEIKAG